MLERCDAKVSCTVLRGEWGREAPDLPGLRREIIIARTGQILKAIKVNCQSSLIITKNIPPSRVTAVAMGKTPFMVRA
jgi:hypothetical protein